MSKTVKIGSVWTNEIEVQGELKKVPSIRLGSQKNKDPKYNLSVEIIVRDNEGKVIAQQKDGFINMYTPNDNAPAKLKYDLVIPRNS